MPSTEEIILLASRHSAAGGRPASDHPEPAGNAAPRVAHVHEFWMVLRRTLRPGNGAGHPLRRTRGATRRAECGRASRRGSEEISVVAEALQKEKPDRH